MSISKITHCLPYVIPKEQGRQALETCENNQNVVLYFAIVNSNPALRRDNTHYSRSITCWNEDYICESLGNGNYIPALESIWTSGSPINRLKQIRTLREMDGPLHPFFMLERVLYLYQIAPKEKKVETVKNTCLPLLFAAKFRSMQDVHCAKDKAIPHGYSNKIIEIYSNRLNALIEKDGISKGFLKEIQNDPEVVLKVKDKVKVVALRTLNMKDLPNPVWIAAFTSKGGELNKGNILPEAEYKEARKKYARLVLNKIKELTV